MIKLIYFSILITASLGASANPVSYDDYQIVSRAFEIQGYKLSEHGTKRIVISEVEENEEYSIGWISSYPNEVKRAEFFKVLERGIGEVVMSMNTAEISLKCFENAVNSTPNINCTAVVNDRFQVSVYLPKGKEDEFTEMMILIYRFLKAPMKKTMGSDSIEK